MLTIILRVGAYKKSYLEKEAKKAGSGPKKLKEITGLVCIATGLQKANGK